MILQNQKLQRQIRSLEKNNKKDVKWLNNRGQATRVLLQSLKGADQVFWHFPWTYTNLPAPTGCLPKFWETLQESQGLVQVAWESAAFSLWFSCHCVSKFSCVSMERVPSFPPASEVCDPYFILFFFSARLGFEVLGPSLYLLSICMCIFIHFLRAVVNAWLACQSASLLLLSLVVMYLPI